MPNISVNTKPSSVAMYKTKYVYTTFGFHLVPTGGSGMSLLLCIIHPEPHVDIGCHSVHKCGIQVTLLTIKICLQVLRCNSYYESAENGNVVILRLPTHVCTVQLHIIHLKILG